MEYFEVTAKCGHVGKGYYYRGVFYLKAQNASEAAEIVRNYPRVKHDHKDAIMEVKRITREQCIRDSLVEYAKPYYACTNRQEQEENWDKISPYVYPEDHQDKSIQSNTRRHSLNWLYNVDPLYEELKSYTGRLENISSLSY